MVKEDTMLKTALYVTCILAIAVIATPLSSHAAHKPVFTWQVRGDVNYRQWIYDSDDPIALFDMSTLDEPMQALMMFSKVPKPLLLRHLKLSPGGKPLVEAVQLYWKCGEIITDVLDGLSVEGSGTDRLTVTFTVKDKWDTVRILRVLTVTYDAVLDSYVYDFKDRATINYPETFDTNSTARFEYCDPWFTDCPAPSQHFPGMWKGRYRQFVYESRNGGIVSIPHHHYGNSQKGGIVVKNDGIFAAVYEPDGNPAIQIMGDYAETTSISICPWGYDVHMSLAAQPRELYQPLTTHFRIFRCPDEKARELNAKAVAPSVKASDQAGLMEMPLYERQSSFEKGIAVGKPHEGDIDPWGWAPQDEPGAVWDRSSGRTGTNSLKISKDTPGISTWYTMCEGQGYFTEPWTPCKGYEITCWVKTENVDGPGASIGACYHIPNIPPKWAVSRSQRLTGTNGWTKLTLRLGPPPDDTSIMSLHFQQAGKGTTRFDDIDVKMLK